MQPGGVLLLRHADVSHRSAPLVARPEYKWDSYGDRQPKLRFLSLKLRFLSLKLTFLRWRHGRGLRGRDDRALPLLLEHRKLTFLSLQLRFLSLQLTFLSLQLTFLSLKTDNSQSGLSLVRPDQIRRAGCGCGCGCVWCMVCSE